MINLALPHSGQGVVALCLAIAGGAMALIILISKLAAMADVPMLWFLTVVMGLSGAVMLAFAGAFGQLAGLRGMLPYVGVAGVFAALPSGIGYLAVIHVGAGFVSLGLAFPILLTWVLARLLGLEQRSTHRLIAVMLGLLGGIILASAKFSAAAATGAAGWVLLTGAIPLILAAGNIFRSKYWPRGAGALTLAGPILITGAAATLPFAALTEASPIVLWQDNRLRLLVAADVLVFIVQYTAYLNLQRIGGPVTLSLLGPVAAVVGAPAALILFDEALPAGFGLAGVLVAAGVVLMLRPARMALPACPVE